MKQSEAGDAVFFAGGGTACLSKTHPSARAHCQDAWDYCKTQSFTAQGCVATPHNRRFVASGHGQGRVVVGCEGVGGRGGCSVRKVAQVARATNERRQDGKLEL